MVQDVEKFMQEQVISNEKNSPFLPEGVQNFLIDIDGTICDDVPNEDPARMQSVEPYDNAREFVNRWFDNGHIITFFTSRTEDLRLITEAWLIKHGFKFHGILMNKPRGGNYHWIDNHIVKSTLFKGKFTEFKSANQITDVFED
ncbi:MAG: phosphoheptose isomerase [Saprospiraceae bacterium]